MAVLQVAINKRARGAVKDSGVAGRAESRVELENGHMLTQKSSQKEAIVVLAK